MKRVNVGHNTAIVRSRNVEVTETRANFENRRKWRLRSRIWMIRDDNDDSSFTISAKRVIFEWGRNEMVNYFRDIFQIN